MRAAGEPIRLAAASFLARRNTAKLVVGDRVIIQTETAGQARGLVMGERDGEILVRFCRWGATLAVEPAAILRRLDRKRRL
jgi:hypothetical protein